MSYFKTEKQWLTFSYVGLSYVVEGVIYCIFPLRTMLFFLTQEYMLLIKQCAKFAFSWEEVVDFENVLLLKNRRKKKSIG